MTDITKKSAPDLMKDLEAKREELRTLRFDLAGTLKKKANKQALKKEVARTLTELSARKGSNE